VAEVLLHLYPFSIVFIFMYHVSSMAVSEKLSQNEPYFLSISSHTAWPI